MSAPPLPRISAPSRPTRPYISLDDPNTEKFFTRSRIRDHLRRAHLLNRHGEILTEAEYDSRQTDVAIGRENRRKIDDAIMEVLKDMAREHWAYARDHTKGVEMNLRKQFGRIQKQFSRRTQPITIRYNSDGRLQLDSIRPITDNHSNVREDSAQSSTEILSPVPSAEHDNMRQELDNIRLRVANLEEELNTDARNNEGDGGLQRTQQSLLNLEEQLRRLNGKYEEQKQRIDERYRQSESHDGQTNSSEVNKQQIEHFIQQSPVFRELHDRLLILETSFRHSPTDLSQEAIKISEEKTIDRERIIENSVRSIDDKIKQIETQLAQSFTRLERPSNAMTRADVMELIRTEIQNFQQNNHEDQDSAHEAIHKVNLLENQLNQFFQSNGDTIPPSTVGKLVSQPISKQQSASQPKNNFEQRLQDLERRLTSIPLPADLSPIEQRLTQLENYRRNMMSHLETKPDYRKDSQRNQDSERQTDHALDKSVKENQRVLKTTKKYSSNIRPRFNQQATTVLTHKSNSEEDSMADKPTSKELQAIMPFIELLPAFDMFNENEWI